MIIKTKIFYSDDDEENLFGKSAAEHESEILVDLSEVGAIMPADDKGEKSIVFLQGRDIMILTPYQKIINLWYQTKKSEGKTGELDDNEILKLAFSGKKITP